MDSTPPAHRPQARPFPLLGKAGFATIGFGLLFDFVEHTLTVRANETVRSGFAAGEHAAHLVVLVGMVLVLVGVIADGVRTSGRVTRPEGSPRDAVR